MFIHEKNEEQNSLSILTLVIRWVLIYSLLVAKLSIEFNSGL